MHSQTRTASRYVQGCVLLFISLFGFLSASAQQFDGDDGFFLRKGYTYKPGRIAIDTISVPDLTTGETIYQGRVDSTRPLFINGNRVYDKWEVTTPAQVVGVQLKPEEYLFAQLKDYIWSYYFKNTGLASVRIRVNNVIVDEKGEIVFFEFYSVTGIAKDRDVRDLENGELPARIKKAMSEIPPMKPATRNGVKVMAYADINFARYVIERTGNTISYIYSGSSMYRW